MNKYFLSFGGCNHAKTVVTELVNLLKIKIMIKKYGIFWLSTQRELYRDDSYYVLGTIFGLFETFEDAENKVKELVTEGHIITILPIYQKE